MSSSENETHTLAVNWILGYTRGVTVLPNNETTDVYSKLLCYMAGADGVLTDAEREWILGQRAAIGASPELIQMLRSYNPSNGDWKELVDSKRSLIETAKYMLIHDAFEAAGADDELHAKELEAISKLGQELGIDQTTIEKIAQLYKDEREIKKRRLALIFPDGPDQTTKGGIEKGNQ